MRVLVTGANGFVGRHLVVQLLQNNHQLVRCFRQINTDSPKPACRDVAITINSQSDWSEALVEVSHVVHCAAHVHVFQGDADSSIDGFREVNNLGTINLARQAAKAGVERFIFISTIGVNGNVSNDKSFSETDEPNPHNTYAQSKWEAEKALMQLAAETEMDVVVIRPPMIYGPGAPGNFSTLQRILNKQWPLPFAGVRNKRAFVAVENLVSFIDVALQHPAAKNQLYLISDGNDVSLTMFLSTLIQALQLKTALFYFPATILRHLLKLVGKGNMADQLYGNLALDITKAKMQLQWEPVITMFEQMKKCRENS
ncbi:NAD-dependent epimerase/dehydratase family protein [Methylophaga sp. OBS3]|uniref:NAD-dependent epimerase/dehydratase family protein n=1 Tax=Methylophaga sp. OBS3 TaxID=2991934 RepID=UPI00224FF1BC|nr:NAD-dependent epimerase/dehydratase family protein [Methylophaga sp. OBS3]MCX4190243.1 NAD-dependent epimerase/dehydratase family protein [Methylophaga sp. OBS3]